MPTISLLGKSYTYTNGQANDGSQVETDMANAYANFSTIQTDYNNLVGSAYTLAGVKTFSSTPKMDAIAENTSSAGVTVDGTLVKDGFINLGLASDPTSTDGGLWVNTTSDILKFQNNSVTQSIIGADRFYLPVVSADPSTSLSNGHMWYNSTSNQLKARINSATTVFNFLTKTSYESAEQTVTAGGTLSLTHSLGGNPDITEVWMRCKTAEYGFAIGDEVLVSVNGGPSSSGSSGITSYRTNTTQIQFVIGNVATSVYVNRVSATTGNGVGLTNANWRIVVRAVRFA